MAAVIALRPDTERGAEILDELEEQTDMRPTEVMEDGTRGYYLDAANEGVDAFDPMLDRIDSDWRDYITTGRNRPLIP
jgi:hypothetical protein